MSVFSKIFIVINLFLTLGLVGVMGTLLSQKADYKAKYTEFHKGMRNKRAELRDKQAEFKEQLESLQAEEQSVDAKIKELDSSVASAAATRQKNESDLNSKKKQAGELRTKKRKTDKAYADLDREVKDLMGELSRASSGRSNAVGRRKMANSGLKSVKDVKQDLSDTLATLQRNYKKLGERKKRAQFYITQAKHKHDIPVEQIARLRLIPDLQGVVARNSPDVELCIISLGKNDGVYKGLIFRVSRGNQYVGLVKVKDVFPNMCSARYLLETFFPGQTIKAKDTVLTERK